MQKHMFNLHLYESFYLRNPHDDGTTIYFDAYLSNKIKIGRVEYIYNNKNLGIHIYSDGQHYHISDYAKAPYEVKMNTIRNNIHSAFDTWARENYQFYMTQEKANEDLRYLIPQMKRIRKELGATHPTVQKLKIQIVRLQHIFYQKGNGVKA